MVKKTEHNILAKSIVKQIRVKVISVIKCLVLNLPLVLSVVTLLFVDNFSAAWTNPPFYHPFQF